MMADHTSIKTSSAFGKDWLSRRFRSWLASTHSEIIEFIFDYFIKRLTP